MIFDTIENYELYKSISSRIAKALKIAAETDFEKMSDGRYDVDADNLFYIVQRYKTNPPMEKIEAHRKYIDLQFIVKGSEQIGYAAAGGLKVHTPYDDGKDVSFFNTPTNTTFLKMSKGDFAIFWPSDAHMPGRENGKPEDIIKIVFKIKV